MIVLYNPPSSADRKPVLPMSLLSLAALLERDGHHCDVVGDGAEAVAAAQDRAYDVVLMDVQMPGLDGLEATRRIRAGGPNARTPVVAVTASVFPEERQRCLEAGMNGHLSKPVRADELRRALARATA